MRVKDKTAIERLEFLELFEVRDHTVNRWGFFAKQQNGNYAIFKPQKQVYRAGSYFLEDDFDMEPGEIREDVPEDEISRFLSQLKTLYGLPLREVNNLTPSGWYYDTII